MLTESLRIARAEFPDPIVMGDRLALLAVASAMQRQDVVAARWWGAAEGLLADQELTPRMRLSARLLDHADQLARRLDGRFEMLATAGSLPASRHRRAPGRVTAADRPAVGGGRAIGSLGADQT